MAIYNSKINYILDSQAIGTKELSFDWRNGGDMTRMEEPEFPQKLNSPHEKREVD